MSEFTFEGAGGGGNRGGGGGGRGGGRVRQAAANLAGRLRIRRRRG